MDCSRFYLICVQGQLKPGCEDWFGGLSQQALPGCTLLLGSLPDQSALLGLLDVIHNLGLTLIAVHSLGTSPAEAGTNSKEI